ncbi:MAG: type IV pilus secretin PilQ [Candidatus Omnitrophota bacterium]|nr:type IV pilus secretin PilQ [Candidatus Omnitrophota bacterium]
MKERGIIVVKRVLVVMLALGAAFLARLIGFVDAQEPLAAQVAPASPNSENTIPAIAQSTVVPVKEELLPGKITIDFKDADIHNVLKVIALKAGVNIVTSPEVTGTVTIRLVDVSWKDALKTIISAYSYGYEQRENIIMVAPLEKLTEQKKQEVELNQVQPTATEVFTLKYIDAQDAKNAIEPQLSSRGQITVLETTGQAGWAFGKTDDTGKRKRSKDDRISLSKTVIITDVPPVIDKIKKMIVAIDVKPQQVLIEAKIIEANKDHLRDLGIDWGTGSSGASSSTLSYVPVGKNAGGFDNSRIGGHVLSDLVTPTTFTPKTSLTSANTGLKLAYRKLTGSQLEIILHALEEDVDTNILSAPRIMTLNNQEATILVGQKFPLITTSISTQTNQVTGSTLDRYQDIGIQLNVVPQICDKDYINMIIHPAVTSSNENVESKTESGVVLSKYPIINTREVETQILLKDGETVVIGGLLKDVKTKSKIGVPFLGKIPLLGLLFQRETNDTEKIDLLIFITARVIREEEFSDAYIATLEERLNTFEPKKKKKTKK